MNAFLRLTTDIVFAVDRDWRITYGNPRAQEFLGKDSEGNLGRILWDTVPELASSFHMELRRAMVRREPVRHDGFYPPLSRWFDLRAYPMSNGLTVHLLDISDRKQAENDLRHRECQLRAIVDYAVDGIVTIDERGVVESFNPAAEHIFGYGAAEIVGHKINALMPEPERTQLDTYLKSYIHSGPGMINGVDPREVTGLHKDGSLFPVDLAVSEFRSDGRRLFIGIVRDITERRRADEAIRRSEAQLQAILDNAPCQISLRDMKGRYLLVNPAWGEPHDLTIDDVRGRTLGDFFPEEFVTPFNEHIQEVIESGKTVEKEVRFLHPDGIRAFLSVKFPIRNTEGEICSIGSISTDITDRKKAEEALKESQARQHFLLSASPAILYICEAQGDYAATFISANIKMQLGYGAHEFTNDPTFWARHLHPDDAPRALRDMEDLPRTGHHVHEYRFQHKDGTYRWMHDEARLVRDPGSCQEEIVGYWVDITERKQAEEELRRSEERFQDFAESGSDWLWEMDADLRYTYLSSGYEQHSGVSPEDVVGRTRAELYAVALPKLASDEVEQWEKFNRFVEARETFRDCKVNWVRPNGEIRHFVTSGKPVFDLDGTFRGYRGTGTDLTKQVEAEQALHDREQRLRGILDNLTEGVITMQANGVIESINAATVRMFGYLAEEVVGQNVKILMPEPDHSQHDKYLERYLSGGERKIVGIGPREVTCRRKDGSVFPAELAVSDVQHDGLQIFIGVMRDITARKRREEERADLEARLRQSQKMEGLGTLAGGIAHDLNNVLVPILGLTGLTLEDLPADSLARANLEKVVGAARRGRDLVSQILAFSRREEPNRQPVELSNLIREISSLLRATLPSTIEIRERLDETLGPIIVDSTQIHQVLMNLSSNARDAMGLKAGVLEIALGKVELDDRSAAQYPDLKPGCYASVTVSDTGPGMDQDTVQRIFEPFYTTKAVGEGTGLGLSVVHGIITAHGGAIDVRSQLGRGTTFEILLPIE